MIIHARLVGEDLGVRTMSRKKPPTFFATGVMNDLIFEISNMNDGDMDLINSMVKPLRSAKDGSEEEHADVRRRMQFIRGRGYDLKYVGTENETFRCNMMLIDAHLPEMIGAMLIEFYINGVKDLEDLAHLLSEKNPLGYDISQGHPFYSYKIEKLLLGTITGEVSGAFFVNVEEAGEGSRLYCGNEFGKYLLKNTCLVKPPASHKHAFIDKTDDGRYRMSLGLRIKFKPVKDKNGESCLSKYS